MTKFKLMGLSQDLATHILKRGYFLLSTKKPSEYWVDMYHLSHLFNAYKDSKEYCGLLKGMICDIIEHQRKELNINTVICPRWTCSTDDLFSETLLNIFFELLHDKSGVFGGLTIYELFIAGEKGSYYLSPVNEKCHENAINAVAFLALDIHFGMIEDLLKNNVNNHLKIDSVISVVGRIKPEKRAFSIIPLFDAWDI